MTIKKQIFMGSGEQSMAQCYEMICILQDALGTLNSLQQQGLNGYDVNWQEIEESKEELTYNVQRLVLGLTGKKVKLSKIRKWLEDGS